MDENAISRLRYSPRRKAVPLGRAAASAGSHRASLAEDRLEAQRIGVLFGDDFASSERGPDHAAERLQAERDDVDLVKLAAAKLAGALHEVHVLLRGDRGAQRSDALARCTAKGWLTLHGDPLHAAQTFRVSPEGYRAAGLTVPPFIA
jgi:hypothetical protein